LAGEILKDYDWPIGTLIFFLLIKKNSTFIITLSSSKLEFNVAGYDTDSMTAHIWGRLYLPYREDKLKPKSWKLEKLE
jgi:hypothetical protein